MAKGRPLDVERELLEAFTRSGRVSEYLVSVLPAALWRTPLPSGRGRSIAIIVAHMAECPANVRAHGRCAARSTVARSRAFNARGRSARATAIDGRPDASL